MLVALHIKNFVLIEALELRLEPGFNVLTGETGAGKSIVVGALNLVLGGRASPEIVRSGADEAEISALFDVSKTFRAKGGPLDLLAQAGDLEGEEISIRRVVQATGRSRAYLNGRLCTASELSALGAELADVASQHESVRLTDASSHLDHLDRFARLVAARDALALAVATLEGLHAELAKLRERERSRGERESFVRFQLDAIDALDPKEGELERLSSERSRLRHAERLQEQMARASALLEASEHGVCDQLARAVSDVRASAALDESLTPLGDELARLYGEIMDAARDCARYAERGITDPGQLSGIEERMFALEALLRRQGPTMDDLLEGAAKLRQELVDLEQSDARIADKEQAIAKHLVPVTASARKLSQSRRAAAVQLGDAISRELGELGMGDARVLVDIEPASKGIDALSVDGARLSRDGIDRVEFLISPNRGVEPKPLRKIASGGELSRALLALKRVLAESGPANLYVFDEVDAGVGGAVAEKLGRAMADVARHHQVLCITHLAPIAAFGQTHFTVEKRAEGKHTISSLRALVGEPRVAEIARMLAGEVVTKTALETARELLAQAGGASKPSGKSRTATANVHQQKKPAKKRDLPSRERGGPGK